MGGVVAHAAPEGNDAEDVRLAGQAATDPRAFDAIYRRHYRMIAAYLFRRTADVHASEDLAAETFLSAFRSVARMHALGVAPRLWLLKIATHSVSRWSRTHARRRRRESLGARPEGATPPPGWSDAQLALHAALARLPDRFASVLSLHHMGGLSVEEVATALGSREGTVKSRLSRGRELLRRELERCGGAR